MCMWSYEVYTLKQTYLNLQLNSTWHPFRVAKSSTSFSWGGVKPGKVKSPLPAGMQVKLCDPISRIKRCSYLRLRTDNSQTRVYFSHLHCAIFTYNMAAATLSIDKDVIVTIVCRSCRRGTNRTYLQCFNHNNFPHAAKSSFCLLSSGTTMHNNRLRMLSDAIVHQQASTCAISCCIEEALPASRLRIYIIILSSSRPTSCRLASFKNSSLLEVPHNR